MVLPLPVKPFRKTDPCLSSPNSATYLRGGTTANSLTPGSERGAAAADLHLLAEEAEEAEEEPKVELLEKKKMKRLVETVEVEEETRVLGKEGEALVVKVTVGLVDEHQMTCVGMAVQVEGKMQVMERTWAAPCYRTTEWTI